MEDEEFRKKFNIELEPRDHYDETSSVAEAVGNNVFYTDGNVAEQQAGWAYDALSRLIEVLAPKLSDDELRYVIDGWDSGLTKK